MPLGPSAPGPLTSFPQPRTCAGRFSHHRPVSFLNLHITTSSSHTFLSLLLLPSLSFYELQRPIEAPFPSSLHKAASPTRAMCFLLCTSWPPTGCHSDIVSCLPHPFLNWRSEGKRTPACAGAVAGLEWVVWVESVQPVCFWSK